MGLLSWGMVQMARDSGIKAGLLKLVTVWPVPEEQILEVAKNVHTVITVEMNIGKYAVEIERLCGGLCHAKRATKNLGMVHTPQELLNAIKEVRP